MSIAAGCSAQTSKTSQECATPEGSSAMWVDADCVDPEFDDPVVDNDTSVAEPVPHRQVSGHFESSGVRFNVYLPPNDLWQGRFFHTVYPLASENADSRSIEFAASNGGYVVQTDSSAGYRADAAAAKFARTVASDHYGTSGRIYGYITGGSGGSYQTIAAMENSDGVWDGGVPYIVGDPSSIPNNFFARALARLILADKAPQIADAVAPGGSSTPLIGLDEAEMQALQEVTHLGLPIRAWEDSVYLLGQRAPDALLGFTAQVRQMDPTYADDFWTLPGYLGTEQSALGDRVRMARIDARVRVAAVERQNDGIRLTVAGLPKQRYDGLIDVTPTGPGGEKNEAVTCRLAPGSNVVEIASAQEPGVLSTLSPGATVDVDNRWYVAAVGYPRHQIPTRAGFEAYDQYRNDDGTPRYPQRPVLAGEVISEMVSEGGSHTGDIQGKVIAVSNILDADAFPLHGDWYRRQVHKALGDRSDDNFRLWYFDNADHHAQARTPRLIDFTGVLETALRDVAAWVERGETPAKSTRYKVHGGQVELPASAVERRGIQAAVALSANGGSSAEVRVGQPVRLHGVIDLPAGSGEVTEIAWNSTGTDEFVVDTVGPKASTAVHTVHTVHYDKPGIYFPALRVTTARGGESSVGVAGVQALGRNRIVVRD